MKYILVIIIVFGAALAGYLVGHNKSEVKPEPVIYRDPLLLSRIDSLETVSKVRLYFIDSLKLELTLLKKTHEKINDNIDSLPAPELYRRITEYYSRKQ